MIKDIIKRFIYREKSSSDSYIKHLRKIGVAIGEDCTIYSPRTTTIDEQYPWMITIGNHVRITSGVILLTHDYSWSVLKRLDVDCGAGAILGASGKITIGNNVFIGMNTIVLRNVSIGDDVIVGVGSVVTKDCESGWVYAGNPAKKIMTLHDYYNKRKELQLAEAKELAIGYRKRFGKSPGKEIFHEYFMLFTQVSDLDNTYLSKMKLCGNFIDSKKYLLCSKPVFSSFQKFIEWCFINE